MGVITKSDLQFTYSWTAVKPDDPKVTGKPDSTELNRHEGYEVLAFLNRTSQTAASALKAERMIHNNLPGNQRSHAHVLKWLQDNWTAY